MKDKIISLAAGFGKDSQSLKTAVLVTILALAGFVFLQIAHEVGEGEWAAIDKSLFLMFRDAGDTAVTIGPAWVEEAAIELTALGGFPVIILLTALVCGGLLAARLAGDALFVLLSVSGGAALSYLLKTVYARPRPDLVDHLDKIHTASFPSGHAAVSTLTYLTLGALLARLAPHLGFRIFVLGSAILLALIIGLSRVYLGVHWPTDVAAGWALGAGWAALSFVVATLLRMKRSRGGAAPRTLAGGD